MNSTASEPLWSIASRGRKTYGKRKGKIALELCSQYYYCFLLQNKTRFYFTEYLESAGIIGEAIEVGTYLGESTSHFLSSWPHCSKIFCIDSYDNDYLADMDPTQKRSGDEIYISTRQELSRRFPGRTKILRKSAPEAAKTFSTDYFDFIYIDGDHSYEGCLRDLKSYYPLARAGALISGHDYSYGGVARAVDDFIRAHEELKGVSLFLTDEHPPSFGFFKP